jgi:hypothetical protein
MATAGGRAAGKVANLLRSPRALDGLFTEPLDGGGPWQLHHPDSARERLPQPGCAQSGFIGTTSRTAFRQRAVNHDRRDGGNPEKA